jgi:hypothetical protein
MTDQDAPMPPSTAYFLAITNEDPERRDGLRLSFVNNTDKPVKVRLRSAAVLDMPSGPFAVGGSDDGPKWKDLGEVSPQSAAVIFDELGPSSDMIVYWTVEAATGDTTVTMRFVEYRDASQYSKPEPLPVLDRDGYPFVPEK